jgi:hypothetical protein
MPLRLAVDNARSLRPALLQKNNHCQQQILCLVFIMRCPMLPAARSRCDRQPASEVGITDGPYLEAKEHVGGFWILETADMDEALASGRKAARIISI